ncbi:hypothetical protein AVEN_205335-1 [Araneus ventricosus]|uniref:Uncharacterized protein n=1 Tax=Araneus ventricosus TaxID=182803 RepID=A0A4Y2LNV4_ARAVE|nr:hypothetical protein AVEN_205335-1 [Araneus ventricosus]
MELCARSSISVHTVHSSISVHTVRSSISVHTVRSSKSVHTVRSSIREVHVGQFNVKILILLPRESVRKCQLPAESPFTRPSVQRPLPHDEGISDPAILCDSDLSLCSLHPLQVCRKLANHPV